MQIGMIGLGRMGANMVRRLQKAGHDCVVFDRSSAAVQGLAAEGMTPAADVQDFVNKLSKPRAIWLMLPAAVVDASIAELTPLLDAGDIIIDGGNSYYKDDIARAKSLAELSIKYVDVGVSGGTWGLERGYCLMIGGQKQTVSRFVADRHTRARCGNRAAHRWAALASRARPSRAICIAVRKVQVTSSRWCITASNTE